MSNIIIIAEAGVNHNGSIDRAKKLIDAAAEAGADYVKFQTFKAENLLTKYAQKAPYQKELTNQDENQYEMIKKLELSKQLHLELVRYCNEKDIKFMSSPFDVESLNMLIELDVNFIKVPSGEIVNYPLLRAIGKTQKKVVLSTGMATIGEVDAALEVLRTFGSKKIILLQCNTEYPTPYEDVNLNAMDSLKGAFHLQVGYSDHSLGIEVPIAAAAKGACIIEKHFTIDKELPGPDHKASLNPKELKEMVQAIRHIERALGSGVKAPSSSEKGNMNAARKSIVAACSIKAGEYFSEENLAVKRPGTGISPMRWTEVVGHVASRDFSKDEMIEI